MALPASVRDRYLENIVYAALVDDAGDVVDVYESIGRAWGMVVADIDAARAADVKVQQ
jgi:hypothetical protein